MHNEPAAPFELPLFPLQTVLFPGGLLPLRIFEVRYLDMIGRCHKAGSPFGVVSLSTGQEVQRPTEPDGAVGDSFAREAFRSVGTLAVIDALDRPQAGLMMIRCTGTRRFRLLSSRRLKHGLWLGEAALIPADVALPLPDDLNHLRHTLEQVVAGFREQARSPDDLPLSEPYLWDDCGWVANRWCELLPMSAEMKQRLMELESPLVRLELVGDLLERIRLAGPDSPSL